MRCRSCRSRKVTSDYQVDRRGEPGLIDELLAEPTTKVVLTRGGLVAVPRGQGELVTMRT